MEPTNNKRDRVAVLGASKKAERYSNKAILLLKEHGHDVIPVNPIEEQIEELPVAHSLREIVGGVDTLTVYVGPRHIREVLEDIIQLRPKRVILNPGTESEELKTELENHEIPFLEACTLVLLKTGQY